MRVLAVIPDPDLPEVHLLRGVAGRADVTVIASETSPRYSQLEPIPQRVQAPFRSRFDGEARRVIRQVISTQGPDVIHCFSSRALSNVLGATKGQRIPIVVYRGTMGRISRLDPSSWLSYLHPRVAGYICVSEAVRQYLLRFGINPARARTIYKGHCCEWYRADTVAALAQFGIPNHAPVVACVANARPVKGVDVLVRAFERLCTTEARLLLIGQLRDSSLAKLIEQSPRQSHIHCTGYRKDAPALVGACNLFVMPSREREGLPKAVIEAMAQSVPVVVSKVGGMPELVLDGDSGIVVPPGDPAALASAIDAALQDSARLRVLGAQGRRRIELHFNIKQTIEETLDFYRFLCCS